MAHRISRQRLDKELVRQGFFKDTQAALRAILAGDVSTRDRRLTSAGELVPEGLFLHVKGTIPYVSRGGLKLERAFEVFDFTVQQKKCLDVQLAVLPIACFNMELLWSPRLMLAMRSLIGR